MARGLSVLWIGDQHSHKVIALKGDVREGGGVRRGGGGWGNRRTQLGKGGGPCYPTISVINPTIVSP